jgi:hypothetical protein
MIVADAIRNVVMTADLTTDVQIIVNPETTAIRADHNKIKVRVVIGISQTEGHNRIVRLKKIAGHSNPETIKGHVDLNKTVGNKDLLKRIGDHNKTADQDLKDPSQDQIKKDQGLIKEQHLQIQYHQRIKKKSIDKNKKPRLYQGFLLLASNKFFNLVCPFPAL